MTKTIYRNGRQINKGDVVRHFKGRYYTIEGFAVDTETDRTMVVYRANYDEQILYCRDAEMFCSDVDHQKHPDVTQQYRFTILDKNCMQLMLELDDVKAKLQKQKEANYVLIKKNENLKQELNRS